MNLFRFAFLLALSCFSAAAATMTFDSAVPGVLLAGDYTEDGVLLSLNSGHYDIWEIVNCDGGSTQCAGVDGNATVRISLQGGGLFTLSSISILAGNGNLTSSTATILNVLAAGTISAPTGFENITHFDINDDNGTFFLFDSIVLSPDGTDARVPEPSSMALFGAGLASLLAIRHRTR